MITDDMKMHEVISFLAERDLLLVRLGRWRVDDLCAPMRWLAILEDREGGKRYQGGDPVGCHGALNDALEAARIGRLQSDLDDRATAAWVGQR